MGIAAFIDVLASAVGAVGKKNMSSFSFLETVSDSMIVAKDGSLATIIKIDGSRQMMGAAELERVGPDINTALSPYLAKPGHAIQIYFSRDPMLSSALLETILKAPRAVAKRLDLDLDDLFDERQRVLEPHIVHEECYMVLWTRLSVLSPQEMKKTGLTMKAPPLWPSTGLSQNIFMVANDIVVRHRSFVSNFMTDLDNFGLRAEVLSGHKAIHAIKSSLCPDVAPSGWRPYLPGDGVADDVPSRPANAKPPFARLKETKVANDVSNYLWPRLDEQLFDVDAQTLTPSVTRIGRYYYAGSDMTIGPQNILPFDALLSRLIEHEFPWRVSFLVESGALNALWFKSLLASIAGFSSSENKLIRAAMKTLQIYKDNGGVVTKFRVSFATWSRAQTEVTDDNGKSTVTENLNGIERQLNLLQRAVESWGYCSASTTAGDPLAGVLGSTLALDVKSTAPVGAAPLEDVISMLPWNRDASPFVHGSVLFRTSERRPWLFQPGSTKQDSFVDIVWAPPGKGKSVFLNTMNLAFCLSAAATTGVGGSQLPRLAIVDIGPSSSGLISLLKEALPANRRHEVEYRRIQMIKDHAINPFDLQLGCRRPMPLERSFLINFLCLMGTEPGHETPSGLAGIAGIAVDELYKEFSDKENRSRPRLYSVATDTEIDNALTKLLIDVEKDQTWWGLVDKFFAKGAIHEATIAQRYAVPRVEDITSIIRMPSIMDIHGQAKIQNGERLIDAFSRIISNILREYPILASPTKFSIGDARVVSLDIGDAAPTGGGSANKQTSIVYMLARFVVARDFFLTEDMINYFEPEYHTYQLKQIKRIRETPKKIVFDEFHRTKASPLVRDQIKVDMREGSRKWGVHIALSSQLLNDFDADMVSFATGKWLMGANTQEDAMVAAERFGLSDLARKTLSNKLHGPGPGGAPFLAVLSMKDGRHEHLLWNTLGPMEIWAFSTTAEDMAIRNRLYSLIGPTRARKRLAAIFPRGSAKEEVSRRQAMMAESGNHNKDSENGVIDSIVNEIVQMERDLQQK